MRFHFIAVCVFATSAAIGAPADDKIKAFEDALKASPPATGKPVSIMNRAGQPLTVEDLDALVQRGGSPMQVENVVEQLMVTHPSAEVQKAGIDLIQELETERKARAAAFETKANEVLGKILETLTQAKKPSDLDQTLKDLQDLQSTIGSPVEGVSPALLDKINQTFQYVTQWQDYMAGMASGDRKQAVDSLCAILNANNQSINAPIILPRSQLLDLVVLAAGGNPNAQAQSPAPPPPPEPVVDPDDVLAKIKTLDDFAKVLPELIHVTGPNSPIPVDWSFLTGLDKARTDAAAGMPVTVDIKSAMRSSYWGDNVSRIVAMELLATLPYYFDAENSNPPKTQEGVKDYLDRPDRCCTS